MTAQSVAILRLVLRDRLTAFTEEIDDMFGRIDRDVTSSGQRVNIGVYYFEEEHEKIS